MVASEAGSIVSTISEPAVVEDEPFDSDFGGPLCEFDELVQIVREVDGFPGVESHEARGSGMLRSGTKAK